MIIKQPLSLTETNDRFDIVVTVDGGGPSGQAGAIRHGISRALLSFNAELRKRQQLRKRKLWKRQLRKQQRFGRFEQRNRDCIAMVPGSARRSAIRAIKATQASKMTR